MDLFITTTNQQSFLLSTKNSNIFLQQKSGNIWYRPRLLSSNFLKDLDCILFNNVLYYCYLNTAHQLIVNRYPSVSTIYSQAENTTTLYTNFKLHIFQKQLYLFYISINKETHLSQIHAVNPLTKQTPILLETMYHSLPSYQLLNQKEELLLQVLTKEDCQLLRIQSDYTVCSIDINPLHAAEANLSNQIEADALQIQLEEKEKQIDDLNEMLQRATTQYNELMHVANSYREEAIKWRNKFF